MPHAEGSISFGVRVVGHPEYRVTVEAVDKDTQTPLTGARIVMHPYKALTDEGTPVEFARDLFRGDRTRLVMWTSELPARL